VSSNPNSRNWRNNSPRLQTRTGFRSRPDSTASVWGYCQRLGLLPASGIGIATSSSAYCAAGGCRLVSGRPPPICCDAERHSVDGHDNYRDGPEVHRIHHRYQVLFGCPLARPFCVRGKLPLSREQKSNRRAKIGNVVNAAENRISAVEIRKTFPRHSPVRTDRHRPDPHCGDRSRTWPKVFPDNVLGITRPRDIAASAGQRTTTEDDKSCPQMTLGVPSPIEGSVSPKW